MQRNDIRSRSNWKKTADFHGHVCPGVAIGFKAAMAGMAWLKEHRAVDEELVAIVETDACGADAVQSHWLHLWQREFYFSRPREERLFVRQSVVRATASESRSAGDVSTE